MECTNCGGVGPEFWVAMAALVIAGGALVIAFREHRVFLRQLRARARFEITARIPTADNDGVYRVQAHQAFFQVEIGVTNVGDRAAGPTSVNVLVPADIESLRWSGPNGEEVDWDSTIHPAPLEPLSAKGRDRGPSQYLIGEFERISTHTPRVRHIKLLAQVPEEGTNVLPIRVKLGADELPDDEQEVVEDFVLRVARPIL